MGSVFSNSQLKTTLNMKFILVILFMLLIAFEPAFSGKILKKLDKELKKMGLQKLQIFLAEIGTNADEIDNNKAHIDNNAVDIGNNNLDIGTNANKIDSNKAHIDNNAVDIGNNNLDIGNNANKIDSNKAHIDINAVDIGGVENDIVSQGSRLLDLETGESGSGSVWFDAVRTSSLTPSGWTKITYSYVRESKAGTMDIGTGVFTAQLAGTYQLMVQVAKDSNVYGDVRIKLDGTTVSYIEDWDKPNRATITGTAIIEMQPGQKVWAETYRNLYSNSNGYIHFTGVLITPK